MGSRILVTGGAGYVGSHCCFALQEAGFEVVALDNLCNSSRESLRRVGELTGYDVELYEVDLRDARGTHQVLAGERLDAVLHFAGLKAVGESVEQPQRYHDNNVNGTANLLAAMKRHGPHRIVFSSSATVYGEPVTVPVVESSPTGPTSPYGESKLAIESMLRELASSDSEWSIALLRYFNPAGAHESGRIGEDPCGVPNNLVPYLMQVAAGLRPHLRVFGDDYATRDGTGVRDYVHVMDLVEGHIAALRNLESRTGAVTYNLGTGRGYSVLEVIESARAATGRPIPHEVAPRRPGDVAECFADASLAAKELGWRAARGLDEMLEDAWRWQRANPNGF